MSSDPEVVSLSGAPVFRYTDGEKEWEAPHGEVVAVERKNVARKRFGLF